MAADGTPYDSGKDIQGDGAAVDQDPDVKASASAAGEEADQSDNDQRTDFSIIHSEGHIREKEAERGGSAGRSPETSGAAQLGPTDNTSPN